MVVGFEHDTILFRAKIKQRSPDGIEILLVESMDAKSVRGEKSSRPFQKSGCAIRGEPRVTLHLQIEMKLCFLWRFLKGSLLRHGKEYRM
jgi:hypothetical protein